jgi:hypothetical protein
MKRYTILLTILAIITINVVLYWSSFDNFLDGEAINYAQPHPFKTVFRHAWNPKWPYCRAFGMLLWRIEYIFFERNSTLYHIENTIVHIIINVLVLFIAAKLFNDMRIGLLAGFIWSTHPMHAENIYILASKFDPQVAILMTTLLLIWMHYSSSGGKVKYWIVMILTSITMFTKEFGITVPLLMFLYHFMVNYKNEKFTRQLKESFIISSPAFIILILFLSYHIGRYTHSTSTPTWQYIFNFIVRYRVTFDHFLTYLKMLHTSWFLIVLMLSGFLKPRKEFFYALFLMVLPVVVILQMNPQVRFMYTASIGFSIAMAYSVFNTSEVIGSFFSKKRKLNSKLKYIPLTILMSSLLVIQVKEAKILNLWHYEFSPERHYMMDLKKFFPTMKTNTIIYCSHIPKDLVLDGFGFYAEYQYFDISIYVKPLINFFYEPSFKDVDPGFDGISGFDNKKRIDSFKSASGEELEDNAVFINFLSEEPFNYHLESYQNYKPELVALKKKYNFKEYPTQNIDFIINSQNNSLLDWVQDKEHGLKLRSNSIILDKASGIKLKKDGLNLPSITCAKITLKCRIIPSKKDQSSASIVLKWASENEKYSSSVSQKAIVDGNFQFYTFDFSDNLQWILGDVVKEISIEFQGYLDMIEVESISFESPSQPHFLQPIPGLPVDT